MQEDIDYEPSEDDEGVEGVELWCVSGSGIEGLGRTWELISQFIGFKTCLKHREKGANEIIIRTQDWKYLSDE